MLHGIFQYSNLHGPWLFYIQPEAYRESKEQTYKWIKGLDADGIIGHIQEADIVKMVIKMGLPTIINGIVKPTLKTFSKEYEQKVIGRMAAKYFLERGFKNFAYCGFDGMAWSKHRGEYFGNAAAESGFETHFYWQPKAKLFRTTGKERNNLAKWLGSLPKPIAVMACNDDCSVDVLAASRIANIEVPKDVAILGVDNDELICELSYPQLSSIALSIRRAGYEIAKLMHKLVKGRKLAENERDVGIFPLYVVTRQSTNIMAIEDRQVEEAVKFIRKDFRKILQVNDIAHAVGLSRRSLEVRFRKALARSVHEEIKNSRVEQMANMLIGTNLSVSQIAGLLGYSNASNISRYFKQQRGISPSKYRKKMGPK
jgi:LacI family transcriptional regulator